MLHVPLLNVLRHLPVLVALSMNRAYQLRLVALHPAQIQDVSGDITVYLPRSCYTNIDVLLSRRPGDKVSFASLLLVIQCLISTTS